MLTPLFKTSTRFLLENVGDQIIQEILVCIIMNISLMSIKHSNLAYTKLLTDIIMINICIPHIIVLHNKWTFFHVEVLFFAFLCNKLEAKINSLYF